MKSSELTGARLSYWAGRAEGIDDDCLKIHIVQDTGEEICIYNGLGGWERYMPNKDWRTGGSILEKLMLTRNYEMRPSFRDDRICISNHDNESCFVGKGEWQAEIFADGETILEAAVRFLVILKFGDEVPEVALS